MVIDTSALIAILTALRFLPIRAAPGVRFLRSAGAA